MSCRPNVCRPNVLSAKSLSAKSLSAKCLSAKCPDTVLRRIPRTACLNLWMDSTILFCLLSRSSKVLRAHTGLKPFYEEYLELRVWIHEWVRRITFYSCAFTWRRWCPDIWPKDIWPTDFWPTDFWPTGHLADRRLADRTFSRQDIRPTDI